MAPPWRTGLQKISSTNTQAHCTKTKNRTQGYKHLYKLRASRRSRQSWISKNIKQQEEVCFPFLQTLHPQHRAPSLQTITIHTARIIPPTAEFDKIIAKEIPSTIVYEDDKVLAFKDINPQAPVHVLVIPKFRDGLTQLGKAEPRHGEILGQLLYAAKIVAEKEGIVDGFRVVINNGPSACGRQMNWPPG
ncbi:Histidine triad (HIT) protein - like 2 [Theobroma cacao]|nr:Histidine triad (HIT) protein - like 2 [Theobroma cacao]